MRNLLIFFTFAVVGVSAVREIVYGPNSIACARKYNLSDDFFKNDFTKVNFKEELMKVANETTRTCIGGCYVKKEFDYLFVPEITIEDMPNILKKGNISESDLKNIRKCNDENKDHNDCEFMVCYFSITVAYAVGLAFEEGIHRFLDIFKGNQTL